MIRPHNVGAVATGCMMGFIQLTNEVGKTVVIARPTSKRTFSLAQPRQIILKLDPNKKEATPKIYSVFVTKFTTTDRHRPLRQKAAAPAAHAKTNAPLLAVNF